MQKKFISSIQKAYLAGFLDGDGSIYVRAKPNPTYKYGFQIAPYVVFFQSSKEKMKFEKICSLIKMGHIRERKDGILEYIISRNDNILDFIKAIGPYVILKREQVKLIIEILKAKAKVKNKKDFEKLMNLIDSFRILNYSKRRKKHILTP